MDGPAREHAKEMTSLRGGLFELVAVAVTVALGVDLLAQALGDAVHTPQWLSFLVPTILILLPLGLIFLRISPRAQKSHSFRGVIILNKKNNDVVRIGRYPYSEYSYRHFSAIFLENGAYAKKWRESNFGPTGSRETDSYNSARINIHKFQNEQIEYYVLNRLSIHLIDYFNNDSINQGELRSFGRGDMPGVLLDNRFLDLFSKPMEDREIFSNHPGSKRGGTVVSAIGSGGAIFDRFELTLPKGTKVSREPDGITIKTPRFSMRIKPDFQGFNSVVGVEFAEYYLSEKWSDISVYSVPLQVDVKFGLSAFLTPAGWEYYQWVDSFIDALEHEFSFKTFLTDIQWEGGLTAAQLSEKMGRRQGERPNRAGRSTAGPGISRRKR